ncbi:Gallinacin-11, partial [Lonchura striata]
MCRAQTFHHEALLLPHGSPAFPPPGCSSTTGNPIPPVGPGLPRDTLRCLEYHGYCFHLKSCPEPFAAFGTCYRRRRTCCLGTCGSRAQQGK